MTQLRLNNLIILFGVLLFTGCSLQKLAVQSTGDILENGMVTIYEESDLVLAEQAIASNLKLLEALIKSDPGDKKLQLMAAEGYTGYALGFVEDTSPQRARVFYLRARDYAFNILQQKEAFNAAHGQDINQFKEQIHGLNKDDVPALFWAANSWGSYINITKTDINALADLPKIEAMMQRVLQLNDTFYYGGPHLFMGTILASRPAMLGGNPQKAQEHFETCLRINEGKFLLAKYFYAKTYAVQVQDRTLFKQLLQDIITAPPDLLPEQRLVNEIAKRKAEKLLAQENDLFF